MRLYGKAIQISKMRPEPLGFNSVIFHEQEEACLEFRNSAPADVPADADAQPSQDLAWKNELLRTYVVYYANMHDRKEHFLIYLTSQDCPHFCRFCENQLRERNAANFTSRRPLFVSLAQHNRDGNRGIDNKNNDERRLDSR